jgi:hypothetical protein
MTLGELRGERASGKAPERRQTCRENEDATAYQARSHGIGVKLRLEFVPRLILGRYEEVRGDGAV